MVRFHTQPLAAPEAGADAALLNLAGHLAMKLGAGLPGEADCWTLGEDLFQLAGVEASAFAEAEEKSRERLAQVRSAFDSLRTAA